MKQKYNFSTTFACFSPLVMIMTFLLELVLLLYVVGKGVKHRVGRLIVLMLAGLGLFQLAEYGICEEFLFSGEVWSTIGFVSITALPPLGLDLINSAAGKKPNLMVYSGYILMGVWFGIFLSGEAISNFTCGGNYIIFHLRESVTGWYGIYYYALLVLGVISAFIYSFGVDKLVKNVLYSLIIGYAAFMIPTSLVSLTFKGTAQAAPSIMCGFAVTFAVILVFVTLPLYEKSTKKAKSKNRKKKSVSNKKPARKTKS